MFSSHDDIHDMESQFDKQIRLLVTMILSATFRKDKWSSRNWPVVLLYDFYITNTNSTERLPGGALRKSCSKKNHKIQWEAPFLVNPLTIAATKFSILDISEGPG